MNEKLLSIDDLVELFNETELSVDELGKLLNVPEDWVITRVLDFGHRGIPRITCWECVLFEFDKVLEWLVEQEGILRHLESEARKKE